MEMDGGKFRGEGTGVGKRGGEEKFRGASPPPLNVFSYNRAWCELHVRWGTSVPVLGFLDLSVLELFGM